MRRITQSHSARTTMCHRSATSRLLLTTLLLFVFIGGARAQALFSENFEGGSMPVGWTTDGNGTWSVGTGDYSTSTGAGEGTYNALIKHGTSGNATKLITPVIDLSTATSAELSFMHIQRSWAGDFDLLKVYYRNSSEGEWIQLLGYTEAVASWTTEEEVMLPNLSSTYQIAFEMTDNYGYGVGIDNIIIVQGASCPKPTGLAVSNITENSATLNWTERGTATAWQICLNGDEENLINVNSQSYTFNGLTALTAYTVKVRAVGSSEKSEWSNELNFTTTAEAEAVGDAWSEDFEGASCDWEFINGNLTNAWTWGSAVNNGGTHALYISNDGGTTNAYTNNSAAMVYATKLLNFTEGKYEFSYDWLANGESSYDYLRVALVPASVILTAGTNAPTVPSGSFYNNLPAGWIALDGGSKLNLATAWENKSVDINVTAGNYYLVFAWRDDTSTGNNPPAAIDDVSITKISCAYEVTDLAVSDISTTGATLTWTSGEATQWQVVYSTHANFEGAMEEIVNAASNNLTGLQPGTHYYAKVRSYCGGEDFGTWSAALEFNTDCVALDLSTTDYSENFDGITVASAYNPSTRKLPVCWSFINTSTSASYAIYPTIYYYSSTNYSHSSPNCLRFYSVYSSNSNYDPQDEYAILPHMDNLAGKQITLQARGYNTNSTFKIGTMSDPTDVSTFTVIATQEGLTTSYPADAFEYIIPSDCTDSYVAIMMEAATSSTTTKGVYIDDITIDFPPTCPKPMGLAVTANSVTAHGATITWTERGEATQWAVEFATDNEFTDVQSETVTVGGDLQSPTYTFQGLDTETTYYVRVKALCSSDDESAYSNVVNFTTTIACPAPTGFAVADLSGYTATLNWTGASESYTVSYRTTAYTDGHYETFTGTSIPTGWETKFGLLSSVMEGTSLTTSNQWSFGTNNGVFDQHARFNIYGSSRNGWLISPAFTVVENASLNFDLALTAYSGTLGAPQPNGTDDKFVVLISTDDEATWTILRQWDNEEGSTYVYNDINSTATGEHVSIDLSSYVGQSVRFAFYGESTESNADNNLHIDNVGCGIYHEAGQWQTVTTEETTVTLTGLTPETLYEAKVQGDCGEDGLSEETGIITFTTLEACPVPDDVAVSDITYNSATVTWTGFNDSYLVSYRTAASENAPFKQNFENELGEWTFTSMNAANDIGGTGDNPAGIHSTVAHSGSYGFRFSSYSNKTDDETFDQYLVSPELTVTGNLNFYFKKSYSSVENLYVGYSTTTNDLDAFTWTEDLAPTTTWQEYTQELPEGVKYIAFHYFGDYSYYVYVDDITIGAYDIPAGDWQTVDTDESTVILTDLTPETDYEVKLQGFCDGEPTEWTEIQTFTTPEQTTVTQTIALDGTSYVSFYVDITLDDLKAAIKAALPGSSSTATITSKQASVKYNRGRWVGQLNALESTQMYKITVSSPCEIVLEGMPIDPTAPVITIVPGANWIAYPFETSSTLTNFFSGFAMNDDQVRSKTKSAKYNRGRWAGQLSTLESGQGYVYISAGTSDRTFEYPIGDKGIQSVPALNKQALLKNK